MSNMSRERRNSEEHLPPYLVYDRYYYYYTLTSEESEQNEESEASEEEEYFRGVVHLVKAFICELQDTSPLGSSWLTKALIIFNILFSLFMSANIDGPLYLIKYFPNSTCILSSQCLDQVIISMFTHVNLLHLIGNMYFLYVVGDNIEVALGKLRFLALYFTSGIVATYIQAIYTLLFMRSELHVVFLGASGAISGLIGAYILLYPGSQMCYCIGWRLIYKCFKVNAVIKLVLIWLTLQFIYLIIDKHIAVWAHIGGFLTGYVLAYVMADRRRIEKLREMFAQGMYKGLKIPEYELHRYSLPDWARGFIVVLSVITLIMVASASSLLLSLNGKYHVVYVDYVETYSENRFISNLRSNTRSITRIYSNFTDEPLEEGSKILLYTKESLDIMFYTQESRYTIIARVVMLNNLLSTEIILVVTATLLVIGTIVVGFKGYREVEVTYTLNLNKSMVCNEDEIAETLCKNYVNQYSTTSRT